MRFISLFLSVLLVSQTILASGNFPSNYPGLVLYLPFNEGSGTTTFDQSRNGNTGTLAGTPAWVTGRNGWGLQFDPASTDVVTVADNASLNSANVTIVCWFKFTQRSLAVTAMVLFIKTRNGENGCSWGIDDGIIGGSGALFADFDFTGARSFKINFPPKSGDDLQGHVLVMTFDGAFSRVYIDGILSGFNTDSTALDYSSSGNLRIGSRITSNHSFYGILDDFMVFNRALSSGEISYVTNFLLGRNEQ